jgi:L-serine dehydratase
LLSILDIFRIGIGPSSSHTVGPMRIVARFLDDARGVGVLDDAVRVVVGLHGSLALTGFGHGIDKAIILGLAGFIPEDTCPDQAAAAVVEVERSGRVALAKGPSIAFDRKTDIHLCHDIRPQLHPNEMELSLYGQKGLTFARTYYSIGGGFIADATELAAAPRNEKAPRIGGLPYPFRSADELLKHCAAQSLSISEIILKNEDSARTRLETYAALDRIWLAMNACIERGLKTDGILPGSLRVKRRAPDLYAKLLETPMSNEREQLFDWLNVYAMATNEENAAGGRVVTAPTNGAAGIIPAVIRHYAEQDGKMDMERVRTFLATAGGIGILYKRQASISGAEMGCQGEVGVACSMAAAGLAAMWGGTAAQVEHAAEIGMEHNLGLTCDPVGGLVQIPCIERNAMGAVKAVNAARLALRASEEHKVSLDQVIETMRQTGLDMSHKYKETSEGGLAVNVVEC